MARPKRGEEKKADKMIGLRVSTELRADLDAVAKREKATITDVIRDLLVEALQARKGKR